MKEKTKAELRTIVQTALRSEYGFSPAKNSITLLESSGDGTYILFSVNGKQYSFCSHVSHIGGMESIWCGCGTIEKIGVRKSECAYGEQW